MLIVNVMFDQPVRYTLFLLYKVV